MISLNSAISTLNALSFKGVVLPDWLGDLIFLVMVVCLPFGCYHWIKMLIEFICESK